MLGPAITDLDTYLDDGGGTAARDVPVTLPLFASHFPRFPVLPGVLILAELAQVAALCQARRAAGRWRLAAVRRVRWRHYVEPGDRMEISVDRVDQDETGEAVFSGSVTVDGRTVATVGELRLTQL